MLLLCGVPWCLVSGVGSASVVSTLPSHFWVFSGLSQVCASSRAEGQHSSVPGSVLLLLLSTPRRWMGLMVLRTQQDEARSCHCNQHQGLHLAPVYCISLLCGTHSFTHLLSLTFCSPHFPAPNPAQGLGPQDHSLSAPGVCFFLSLLFTAC